jgi:hypothetical protein
MSVAAPGGQRHHRLRRFPCPTPEKDLVDYSLERLKQGDQTSYQRRRGLPPPRRAGAAGRLRARRSPRRMAGRRQTLPFETTLALLRPAPDAGDQSVAIPAAITASGNKAGPNSPRHCPKRYRQGRWPRSWAPPALIRGRGGAPTGYSATAPRTRCRIHPPKSSDGEGLQARRHRCGGRGTDRSMISPTGSVDNCSATVLFNPCDASHDVPIRRHKACAHRKRLHGHGRRCTSTIAPYAKQLVRPNDPTGGDRELRARMGRRHGNIMEVVGDVVAQLP